MKRPSFPRRRPHWWPAEEAWPPAGPPGSRVWRQARRFFFWRFLALLLVMLFIAGGALALALWVTLAILGWFDLPAGSAPFLVCGGLFAIGAVGTLAARGLRRVARPLADLVEAAGRVEAGDYGARVQERGPREVRTLARAFNAMASRLQRDDEVRRNLLADITHELRTPLTVLQGRLEGLLDGVYPAGPEHLAPALEETRVLARLVDDLRTLALSESGALQLRREPTDVGVLVMDAVAAFRAQAAAAGVALETTVPDDLPLAEVDPVRLREVLVNLLANALRHTPRGGRVSVQAEAAQNSLRLSVVDNGAGVPPEALPHVFDRFYKAPDSSGSGLGLTIARNLVTAHGGEITAHSAGVPGQGTSILFTLPLRASPMA